MTSFKVILTLISILFLQIIHSSSDYVTIELNTVDNSKCGAENGWSSVDLDTFPFASKRHDKKVLKASSFSCASFSLKVSPSVLEIIVYIEALYDSRIEILVGDNEDSILNYVYDKSNVNFEQGWHTITLSIEKETTAYVTLLGFSQNDDTVIVESIKHNGITSAHHKTDWMHEKEEVEIIDLLSYKNENLNYEDHRSGTTEELEKFNDENRLVTTIQDLENFDDMRQSMIDKGLGNTEDSEYIYDKSRLLYTGPNYENIIYDDTRVGTTQGSEVLYNDMRRTIQGLDYYENQLLDLSQDGKVLIDKDLSTIQTSDTYNDEGLLLDLRQDYNKIFDPRLSTIQYLENLYENVEIMPLYDNLVDQDDLLNQPTERNIELTKRRIIENQDAQILSYNTTDEGKSQAKETNGVLKKDDDKVNTSVDQINAQSRKNFSQEVGGKISDVMTDDKDEDNDIEEDDNGEEIEGEEEETSGENGNEDGNNEIEEDNDDGDSENGGNGEQNGGEEDENGAENGNEYGDNEVEGEESGGEHGVEGEDNGGNGEENTGEDENGEGENNESGSDNESDNDSSFWNIWTITLVSVASCTLIALVVVSAYYLGKNSGGRATSPIDLSDLEAPRIIPRAKTIRPPYERFGSEYGGSGLGRDM